MITISVEQILIALVAVAVLAGGVALGLRARRLMIEAETTLGEARQAAAELAALAARGVVVADRVDAVVERVERASRPILDTAGRAAETTVDLARHAAAFGAGLRTAVSAYQEHRRD